MRINNIKQLQAEKKRISKHSHELESRIYADWKAIKRHLGSVATGENNPKTDLFKNFFAFAIRAITKKVADKATAKITGL
jgi:hypothetical protein